MRFTFMTQRFERLTKFGLQFGWRIAHHREPTAAGWPVLGKRGYDHQTARPDRAKHLLHIGSPILDEDKPACTKCPVHCYKRTQREQVRSVMRYASPRMLWRQPSKAALHMLDKLRNVEHPLATHRKRTPPR